MVVNISHIKSEHKLNLDLNSLDKLLVELLITFIVHLFL